MAVLSNEGVRKQNPQRAGGHITYLTRVVLVRVVRVVRVGVVVVGVLRTRTSREGGSHTRRLSVPQVWKIG